MGSGGRSLSLHGLPSLVLIAVLSLGLAACDRGQDPMPGRELICGRTSYEDCVRVADVAMSGEAGLDLDPRGWQMTVTINRNDCSTIGRGPNGQFGPAVRCWRVEGEVPAQSYSFGRWVYENQDGSLGVTG